MKHFTLGLLVLLLSAGIAVAAAGRPRIISGAVPCNMPFQVELDKHGKFVTGRLYHQLSDCIKELRKLFPSAPTKPVRPPKAKPDITA